MAAISWRMRMKQAMCALGLALAMCGAAAAQSNPVMDSVRQIMQRQEKNLVAAAEEMPAGKYSFRPTSQQMTFATLVGHINGSNYFLCSKISGAAAPKSEAKAIEGKEKLISALKESFSFCNTELAKVSDSGLGEKVKIFGGREVPKAGAAIGLTNDWADHYSQAAMYLRLNGLLPPTAKKKGE